MRAICHARANEKGGGQRTGIRVCGVYELVQKGQCQLPSQGGTGQPDPEPASSDPQFGLLRQPVLGQLTQQCAGHV